MSETQRIFLKGSRIDRFQAIQNCLVPRSRTLTPEQQRRSVELINSILAEKSASIHFKVALFLRVIDALSLLTGGRAFRHLTPPRQNRVMNFFFDSPIGLFRKGFWGISTLAKMGVYGQSFLYDEIGYKLKETPR